MVDCSKNNHLKHICYNHLLKYLCEVQIHVLLGSVKYLYSFPKRFVLLSVPDFLFWMIQEQNLKQAFKIELHV